MRFLGFVLVLSALASSLVAQDTGHWKALLVSGYGSDEEGPLDNWDRSREAVHGLLLGWGVPADHIRALTSRFDKVGMDEGGVALGWATKANLTQALEALRPVEGDTIFLFLTSHGNRHGGFTLEQDSALTVADLQALMDRWVGPLPAVVLISACYSGQFVDAPGLRGSRRVLLSAARSDRSSFGCGNGTLMPEWDESLVRVLGAVPPGTPWKAVADEVARDVDRKESEAGITRHSLPQVWVGDRARAEDPGVPRRP